MKDIFFNQTESEQVVQKYSKSEAMSRLKSFCLTIWEWSKYPIDAGKLLSAGDSIYEHGEKAIHAVAQVAHHAAGVVHNLK